MNGAYRYVFFSALIASLCSPVFSQEQSSRERQALRRAQQQVQKTSSELAAAQEKITAAEAEKAKLDIELGGAQDSLRVESVKARKLQQQLLALKAESDEFRQLSNEQKVAGEQRVLELGLRVAQLEKEIAVARDKGAQLEAVRVVQSQRIAVCEDHNAKLYAVGRSVVDECRERSAKDTVLRLEPFTGIAKVGIENRLEAQRDLLDAQKIQPTPPVN